MGKKILTDLEVKGYIDVDGGIKDANSNFGNSGQFLQTSGSDVVWADAPSASNVAKVTKNIAWNTNSAGVTFQNTSAGDETNTCTITHNLNSSYVIVSVSDDYGTLDGYDSADFIDMNFNLMANAYGVNSIRLRFTTTDPPANGSTFKVAIIG